MLHPGAHPSPYQAYQVCLFAVPACLATSATCLVYDHHGALREYWQVACFPCPALPLITQLVSGVVHLVISELR